jgi:hypothetical protein
MSQQQPRRLRFRGRKLTPDQLAAAQETTWAEKNWNEFESWFVNSCGQFPDRPADLIAWNRRDLPF